MKKIIYSTVLIVCVYTLPLTAGATEVNPTPIAQEEGVCGDSTFVVVGTQIIGDASTATPTTTIAPTKI